MSEVVQSLVGAGLILLATLVIFFGLLLFGPSKVTALLTRSSPGRWVLAALWFIFSVLSGKAFYDRFWIWRECFDENDGRCYVTDVGTMTDAAGPIWGGLTLIFAALALRAAIRLRRRVG